VAYSSFTLDTVKQKLGLTLDLTSLFPSPEPVAASHWLREILERGGQLALLTEKARSEFIVAPILLALREMFHGAFSIYSGEELNVDESRSLVGACDFILTASKPLPALGAPLIVILEAKRGIIEQGLGQCAAQMFAARIRNERENWPDLPSYGCVTSGREWQFLKLEGSTLLIDQSIYMLNDLDNLLGVLTVMVRNALPRRVAAA
jgi:hypothetical protein